MHTIDLVYVGRGPHEELVAYIADQQGFYADEGVHVSLRDGCTWDAQQLRRCAVIGLGRTVLSRLNDGIPWVALHVNTASPLFWFLARPGLTSLADLAGQRLAVTPPHTGPGVFTRIVLRQAGLDVDRDVRTVVRWPGDYAMDLRRLRAGEIDAAMVGDTMAPEALAAEYGWNVLAYVGDHFRIPTVGVAVDPTYIDPDSPAVQAVVRAHRRALQVIQKDPDTTLRYLGNFLGRHTGDEIRAHYEKFIAPYFSPDGHTDLAAAQAGLTAVAAELGVSATFTAAEFYTTATAGSH
ncbi:MULTISPECIES: ABC transporter substrate-binding protein [unclassified Streptomyces]|uniref:ABC transporter substrate-binding protein n=1 Tax=unclassified Streptomyces TaxID=2593676 RepID=UPI002DDB0ADD|nr:MULTISPECIES: ABC transporter substrate-binding protein [unclassified Streptomyces]WSC35235.1 ABC transporter substrate-binding protein [Streptomyces sp. NBC_01763]WSC57491.1 ABC transporter substrate-binding protein [Streptomyces sp. NBC_01761]WSF88595.1 ABC transporter substrate-binding protein [Streptomyces sp. NBC_01744]WSJ54832.1 ABC transporter substrate-binding protein [Streptomyces sp. NBC_01318]